MQKAKNEKILNVVNIVLIIFIVSARNNADAAKSY